MASRTKKVAIPDGVRPVPWSVPTLTAKSAPPPLEMRFDPGEAERERRDRQQKETAAALSSEPGMVLIMAGEFRMGSDDGTPDESPMHTVLLNSYWIDKYPVTNLDYKRFVDATGHQPPPHWIGIGGTYPIDQAEHPVVNVSWHDARAYARWANKRLPTEAEWEKACRGTKGPVYPWGDAFRKDNLNCNNEHEGITSVSAFPNGASPYGVMDMCGNVCEWVEDWYYDEYYKASPVAAPTGPPGGQYKVVRGGFFGENKMGVRCASRHYTPPAATQEHVGFRCAKTPLLPGQQVGDDLPETEGIPEKKPVTPEPAEKEPISADEPMERIATRRPELVAQAVRTLLLEEALSGGKGVAGLSGRQEVATLMIALGQGIAAEVLKYLNDYEIEDIAQAIAGLKTVTAEQKDEALRAFKQSLLAGDFIFTGGVDFARGALERALGPRRAQQMLDRVTATTSGGFYLLRNIAPNQIAPFISKEHPQTIALILAQLDPSQAAGVLNPLPEELQADVSYRLATMENISPQVLREIEQSLAGELQAVLTGQVTKIGGPKKVAEILNRTGRSTEKKVLEKLDQKDPNLAGEIRNQMFTFDDIVRLTDREIQLTLREVDTKDLAIALKGAKPELRDRIFSNVSEQVKATIEEEMKFPGPIRLSDVEEVQLRIVQTVRKLEEAGEIVITRGGIQDIFV